MGRSGPTGELLENWLSGWILLFWPRPTVKSSICRSIARLKNRNYLHLPRTWMVSLLLKLSIDLNFSFSSDHVWTFQIGKKSLFDASLPFTAVSHSSRKRAELRPETLDHQLDPAFSFITCFDFIPFFFPNHLCLWQMKLWGRVVGWWLEKFPGNALYLNFQKQVDFKEIC